MFETAQCNCQCFLFFPSIFEVQPGSAMPMNVKDMYVAKSQKGCSFIIQTNKQKQALKNGGENFSVRKIFETGFVVFAKHLCTPAPTS